jgi:hypothetical protein
MSEVLSKTGLIAASVSRRCSVLLYNGFDDPIHSISLSSPVSVGMFRAIVGAEVGTVVQTGMGAEVGTAISVAVDAEVVPALPTYQET